MQYNTRQSRLILRRTVVIQIYVPSTLTLNINHHIATKSALICFLQMPQHTAITSLTSTNRLFLCYTHNRV